MEYYGVRNGVIDLGNLKISESRFRELFFDTYNYFENKGYFKLAFEGYQSSPALLTPSPAAYFFSHVGEKKVFPIDEYYYRYDKVTMFIVIEILHKYIRIIEFYGFYEAETAQLEFRTVINKYLYHLDDGYELTEAGYIINRPEDGLTNLINSNLPEPTVDTVTEKVETAIKMFFKYDSNMEEKRKAINILADVLEPNADAIENLTTRKHDTMLFGIVNNYGIRHNNLRQKEDYDKPIWYEWMFHYYLSTVHASLKLLKDDFA